MGERFENVYFRVRDVLVERRSTFRMGADLPDNNAKKIPAFRGNFLAFILLVIILFRVVNGAVAFMS